MAVQSTIVGTAMSLKYKAGLDELGNDVIKARKYSNLKVTSSLDAIHTIAVALGNLMRYEVVEIVRNDESLIVQA
jgi:hypothetical protein